jgi:[protein-PII] uridylyltransferase
MLRGAGNAPGELLGALKSGLQSMDAVLAGEFWDNAPVEILVRTRAWAVEQLLLLAWERLLPAGSDMALVAVGGFGRGELHPHSDVDLMILLGEEPADAAERAAIEAFVTLLWDAGFHLGHSVRTLAECEAEARGDVVTATNLMESRLLSGPESLYAAMRADNAVERMWPGPEFFDAKFREQIERHERFEDTAYNLEPNIKEGPGGLRDIQTIGWVAKRHFGAETLHGLVDHGFLTEPEHEELRQGQLFLWRVRYALHLLAGRGEDRLLFDHQRQIAQRFGHGDPDSSNTAVEQFMQSYYRAVMQLERLNERLLQLFQEELLPDESGGGEEIGDSFRVVHGFLEVSDENLFKKRPRALLEIFLLLAKRKDVHGVRAATIRLICDHLHLIDDAFRKDQDAMDCFFELLCQPDGVYTQLQRMNRYGVLAEFIPAFKQVTGRMQFDLFHVYTVDQHILFVVRNLRRFAYGKYREQFPHAPEVFARLDHPEILYLAALFHDIAKGRDGDHSELGAVDAASFCARLPMLERHRNRVAWLVENHLLMSQTAQRKDISDPEIIHDFAMSMGSQTRVDYLYLLTVADIAATSPKLWNSWKDGLLWELRRSAIDTLAAGQKSPVDRKQRTEALRAAALERLADRGFDRRDIERLWDRLPASAFLRFSPGQMTWAGETLLSAEHEGGVLVAIRDRQNRNISEVLVSAPDFVGLIAATTTVFDEMGLNVLSARVVTTRDDRSFDLFQVMDSQGGPLHENDAASLRRRLESLLQARSIPKPVQRRLPRRLRPFASKPEVRFGAARGGTVTSVEIECTDRPGVLSQLAAAMVECEIRIHDAMIATFGDRVEDTFLVSDTNDRLLDAAMQAKLVDAIHRRLGAA